VPTPVHRAPAISLEERFAAFVDPSSDGSTDITAAELTALWNELPAEAEALRAEFVDYAWAYYGRLDDGARAFIDTVSPS
jgi:hypothetical protein